MDSDSEYLDANPSHPGEHLAEYIRSEGWSVAEAARKIGLSKMLLHRILAGKGAITAKTAVTLERMEWGSADLWMRLQAQFDLIEARRNVA